MVEHLRTYFFNRNPQIAEVMLQFKITAEQSLITELKNEIELEEHPISVSAYSQLSKPAQLKLGMPDLASIVIVIESIVLLAELSDRLYKVLMKNKGRSILIQTPYERIEIVRKKKITKKEVKRILEGVTKFKKE
jgi:hypothetical protein